MYLKNCKRVFYIAGVIVCAACGNNRKQQPQAAMLGKTKPAVVVSKIMPASYQVTERFPGTLVAHDMVALRPDVTGYLENIKVKDGSKVMKGQVLYEIDKRRYAAAYGQVAAAQRQAEADLAQRQRDYERYKNLLAHDAISKQMVDQAYTAMLTAKANVAAAKAAVDKAGTDVNHALVRAPVSGRIGIVQIKVGDIVNAGQTLINTLVNDQPMFADMDIPQSRLLEFIRLQKNQDDKQFFIQFSSDKSYQEAGKIHAINNIVDPQTGTVRVRLVFQNKDDLLKSGMSIVLLMQYNTPTTQLAIPVKSIIQHLSETSVYMLTDDNVVRSQQIVPGAIVDTMMLVASGLSAGDRVIVEGIQKVKPGDTVNVVGAAAGKR